MTTPAERQRVLDRLGKTVGFPFRAYTSQEWLAAYREEGIEMRTEETDQGEQIVIPGAERSARQAAQAREDQGRGKIRARKAQREPSGLFETKETEQPKLL